MEYPKLWITNFAIFVLIHCINHLFNFSQTHFTHKMLQHKSREDWDNLVSTNLCKQSVIRKVLTWFQQLGYSHHHLYWTLWMFLCSHSPNQHSARYKVLVKLLWASQATMNEKRDIWLKRYFYLVSFLHHRTELLKYRKILFNKIGIIDSFKI